MFYPDAQNLYQLPTVYLSLADIFNLYLFVGGCCLDISRFYEEQCLSCSESVWPAYRGVNTICTTVFQTTVTAPL